MSAESVVKSLLSDVPKALAAGVVDMGTGMLLAVKTVESHPQAVIDLLAAATRDMFEGDSVTMIENIFKKVRGVSSNERYFKEIMVSSTNLWHYFGRMKNAPSVVIVVVARGDVNLGTFLVKARSIAETATL